jgi:uncharacterized protein YbjT (DUF2867 family)
MLASHLLPHPRKHQENKGNNTNKPRNEKVWAASTQPLDVQQRKALETQHGKALADAAVRANAHALIWSSLPRIGLPNFDSKADVQEYIRELPIKSVFYMPGWFMQNHLTFSKPVKQNHSDSEAWVLKPLFPGCEKDTLVPLIDNEDIGKFLQPFLDDVEGHHGAELTAASAFVTPMEMCAVWSRVTGKLVRFEGAEMRGEEEKKGLGEDRGSEDSWYYGTGSRKAMEWTLGQMGEKTTNWEGFVKRVESDGGWFN